MVMRIHLIYTELQYWYVIQKVKGTDDFMTDRTRNQSCSFSTAYSFCGSNRISSLYTHRNSSYYLKHFLMLNGHAKHAWSRSKFILTFSSSPNGAFIF